MQLMTVGEDDDLMMERIIFSIFYQPAIFLYGKCGHFLRRFYDEPTLLQISKQILHKLLRRKPSALWNKSAAARQRETDFLA